MSAILLAATCSLATADESLPRPGQPQAPVPSEADTPRAPSKPEGSVEEELLPGEVPRNPVFAKELKELAERVTEHKKQSVSIVTTGRPDPQMQAVLDELSSLGGKPLESLSAEEARRQPSPADAANNLAKRNGVTPKEIGKIEDVDIKLRSVDLKGRVYRPKGDGPFPVILYIHGGGWVVADLDTYDATPRALCGQTGALVISAHYRQAPEHKFPTAHNDVYGAYQWTLENAGRWSGNARKVAVVGESAGGNMAASVCIMAQADGKQMPVHQVLVYPVADTSMDTPSYIENKNAKPLNAAMMKWFFDQTLAIPADVTDTKVALLKAKSLRGLPPATIITAQIDPLRSEGEALAKKMEADGVKVAYRNYDGVTHEFFGMGAVVDKGADALQWVSSELKKSFAEQGD